MEKKFDKSSAVERNTRAKIGENRKGFQRQVNNNNHYKRGMGQKKKVWASGNKGLGSFPDPKCVPNVKVVKAKSSNVAMSLLPSSPLAVLFPNQPLAGTNQQQSKSEKSAQIGSRNEAGVLKCAQKSLSQCQFRASICAKNNNNPEIISSKTRHSATIKSTGKIASSPALTTPILTETPKLTRTNNMIKYSNRSSRKSLCFGPMAKNDPIDSKNQQQQQQQHHKMTPTSVFMTSTTLTGTPKSHQNYSKLSSGRRRIQSTGSFSPGAYAGAKFSESPAPTDLPPPPIDWMLDQKQQKDQNDGPKFHLKLTSEGEEEDSGDNSGDEKGKSSTDKLKRESIVQKEDKERQDDIERKLAALFFTNKGAKSPNGDAQVRGAPFFDWKKWREDEDWSRSEHSVNVESKQTEMCPAGE